MLRALGFPDVVGTIIVSLLNSTSVIEAVAVGFLVDCLDVTTTILISSLDALFQSSCCGALLLQRLYSACSH